MTEPELLDMMVVDELRESVAGDDAFVKELVSAYLAESPAYLEALESAGAVGDAAGMVRPAHTIKSSSAAIGAMRMAALGKRLEFAAREGRVDASGVAEARSLWTDTLAALAAAGLIDG